MTVWAKAVCAAATMLATWAACAVPLAAATGAAPCVAAAAVAAKLLGPALALSLPVGKTGVTGRAAEGGMVALTHAL